MKDLNSAHLAYVRTILKEMRLSPSGLAKLAGISPTTLTRALNDPGHLFALSTTTISKIHQATGINPAPFIEAKDFGEMSMSRSSRDDYWDNRPEHPFAGAKSFGGWSTIVIGEAAAGKWTEKAIASLETYDPLQISYNIYGRDECFALLVTDGSANRLAEPGDYVVFVSPSRTVVPFTDGDFVAVERNSKDGNLIELTIRRIRFSRMVWNLYFDTSDERFDTSIDLDGFPTGDDLRIIGRAEFVMRSAPHDDYRALMHLSELTYKSK